MKVITTKRHGFYRIKATDGDNTVIVPRPDSCRDDTQEHSVAMLAFCKKFNYHGAIMPGHLKDNSIVWVWYNLRDLHNV